MSYTKTLYHYCSLDTFDKIISNKTLWLSDISKSNDASELKYLKYECQIHLLQAQSQLYKMGMEDREKNIFSLDSIDKAFDDVNLFAQKSPSINLVNSWCICFSELKDSLGQWRGYGNDGSGVSIGFNKSYLSKVQKLNQSKSFKEFELSKVKYSKNKVDTFFDVDCKLNTVTDCKSYEEALKLFNECIVNTIDNAVYFKQPSFSEEKEWRLIFKCPLFKYDGIKFIESNSVNCYFDISDFDYAVIDNQLISHLELKFTNMKKAIDEIIIGPKSKLKINDIKYYLIDKGLLKDLSDDSIQIYHSESTYR